MSRFLAIVAALTLPAALLPAMGSEPPLEKPIETQPPLVLARAAISMIDVDALI